MQGSETPGVKATVKKKSGGQGFLVLFILLLGVGGAGFGLGFTQKFAPIEMVAPDTAPGAKTTTVVPAAGPSTTPATATATTPVTAPATSPATVPATTPATATATAPSTAASTNTTGGATSVAKAALKKTYWIQTAGWDKAGYTITVYINDQPVGNFDSIDRTEDITKFVKPGENKVRFEAKPHPPGDRNEFTGAFLTVTVNQGQKNGEEFTDAQPVVEYKRKVTETTPYDDSMDFAAI